MTRLVFAIEPPAGPHFLVIVAWDPTAGDLVYLHRYPPHEEIARVHNDERNREAIMDLIHRGLVRVYGSEDMLLVAEILES